MAKIVRVACKSLGAVVLAIGSYIWYSYEPHNVNESYEQTRMRVKTDKIVIHHDDINRNTSFEEIEEYHKQKWENGFAYTFWLDGCKVHQAHLLGERTTHALNENYHTIGICIHSADKESIFTKINLVVLINLLQMKYGITKENVVGHCDLNCTQCPDMNLNEIKKWLIK